MSVSTVATVAKVKAHHLRKRLQSATASRVIFHIGKLKLRAVHAKAGCAYGGAFMLGLDFATALLGPVLFPHTYLIIRPMVEVLCAKGGAFLAGAAVFFDRIIEW